MAKYMIHAVPKRMWYVEGYLIPSMVDQGIKREDIRVYCDINQDKNLKACMYAFKEVDTSAEGTWHLQDDVIISHDFKEITEKYDNGIVCGFKSVYDGELPGGRVSVQDMWFSFLCIRIPNKIALECSEWCLRYMIGNPIYKDWWKDGVNDDLMFRRFVWDNYKEETALNLIPNIVDHVDFLIGGTVNSVREFTIQIRSKHWQDEYLVVELRNKLNNREV